MAVVSGAVVVGPQRIPVTADLTLPAAGGRVFTHGREVLRSTVGLAGVGLTSADLTVVSGSVNASSQPRDADGYVTGRWFRSGVNMDKPTMFRRCKFDYPINSYLTPAAGQTYALIFEDCDISTVVVGSFALGSAYFQARRCILEGCSDGLRTLGVTSTIECFVRVKASPSGDHNDGVQDYAGRADNEVLRSNIDARPMDGGGAPNGALFSADGATGHNTWNDNLLAGGAYTIRAQESTTFDIQGNEVVAKTYQYGPAFTYQWKAASHWGDVRPNRLSTGQVIPRP